MNKEIQKRIKSLIDKHIPTGYVYTEAGLLPVEWEFSTLEDITEKLTKTAGTDLYETLSISAGIGFVNQAKKFGKELSGKQYEKYTVLHKGDFSYNKGNSKTYPQGCIYRLLNREVAAVPNVFESFRIKSGCAEYYDQLFISGYLNRQLSKKINHGVRDDGLLNLTGKDFYSCFLPVPPIEEQEKIAEILSACDKVIELKEKLIEEKKRQKKWFIQQLFKSKRLRKFFSGQWETVTLNDVFDYIQPTRFLVENTDYSDDYDIPVVTAGKTFILGHTNETEGVYTDVPVVIFDDFTTDSKYVDFMFKAKSSAMKILKSKPNYNIKFAFSVLQSIDYIVGAHERHWISKFGPMSVEMPSYDVQNEIAFIIDSFDTEIKLFETELNQQIKRKTALTQLLLTGIVRVNKE